MFRLIPHLAAALVIAGCAALTLWQIERAEYKRNLLANWYERAPVAIADLGRPFDLPQPVTGVGNWLPERQLLVDNQVREGRLGVYVLTPWEDARGRLFLVNRGWAPWPARSDPLPDPGLRGTGRLDGVLNDGPAVGVRLGRPEVPEQPAWPVLVTYFDADALTGLFGGDLQPAVIQLDPAHPAHLTGDAWRVVTFGPDRHLGYALTWTTIGLVVAGLWLVLGIRAVKRKRNR